MKFEYWKAKDGKWYWHLKAPNGEVVAQSEGYPAKANCLSAIKLVKSSVGSPEINLTPQA